MYPWGNPFKAATEIWQVFKRISMHVAFAKKFTAIDSRGYLSEIIGIIYDWLQREHVYESTHTLMLQMSEFIAYTCVRYLNAHNRYFSYINAQSEPLSWATSYPPLRIISAIADSSILPDDPPSTISSSPFFFFDFLFYPPFISRRLSFLVAPYRSVQGHLIPGIGNYLQTTLDADKSDCVSFFQHSNSFIHKYLT